MWRSEARTVVPTELHALADVLRRSFAASADLLRSMHEALAARRTSWIAARPSTLAEPAEKLQQAAERLAEEERSRADLLQRIAALLPGAAPAPAIGRRHVNVTQVAAALPREAAARLRQAADDATAAARRVRIELALGERLLQFTQRSQETVLHGIASQTADVGGYDRGARRVHGPLVGGRATTGTLIDGRM